MKDTLSPRDLAKAIGVSESTLKRWADSGEVRVTRTAGGHRRILLEDAVAFIRRSGLAVVQPELIGLPELRAVAADTPDEGEEAERLYGYLIDGRDPAARGLVQWLYLSGRGVAWICDGPIHSSMERLGELWKDRADGVYLEHRATDICVQALQQLRSMISVTTEGPSVVGGAPANDPYMLPSLMAATALLGEGFQVTNLGPDTPLETLVHAARTQRVAFVWLSVTSQLRPKEVGEFVGGLAAELAAEGIPLILGGRSAARLRTIEAPNLHRGGSIAELVAFARGLVAAGSDDG